MAKKKTAKKKQRRTRLKKTPKEKKTVSKYILDPVFNIKNATEQLILLEDHLNFKEKCCMDCIRKHIFAYNALCHEALTLNEGQKYRHILCPMSTFGSRMEKVVASKKFNPHTLAQQIRKIRKPLLAATFGLCL